MGTRAQGQFGPDSSVVGTPARRAGSLRRTASIEMRWPAGLDGPLRLIGRARDLHTGIDAEPEVVGFGEFSAGLADGRTIDAIELRPALAPARALVGARGGRAFRTALGEALQDETAVASPLYFLLDDVAGATVVAQSALVRANPQVWGRWSAPSQPPTQRSSQQEPLGVRKGRIICVGLGPDTHAKSGGVGIQAVRTAGELGSSDDPCAWHELEPAEPGGMRRRRRIDLWRDDDTIRVDAHFRDSYWTEDLVEMALHEYSLDATIDASTLCVVAVQVEPHVLPFPECPRAASRVDGVIGMPLAGFRTSVQVALQGLDCCTHLNDMFRCLAEVPPLTRILGPTVA